MNKIMQETNHKMDRIMPFIPLPLGDSYRISISAIDSDTNVWWVAACLSVVHFDSVDGGVPLGICWVFFSGDGSRLFFRLGGLTKLQAETEQRWIAVIGHGAALAVGGALVGGWGGWGVAAGGAGGDEHRVIVWHGLQHLAVHVLLEWKHAGRVGRHYLQIIFILDSMLIQLYLL